MCNPRSGDVSNDSLNCIFCWPTNNKCNQISYNAYCPNKILKLDHTGQCAQFAKSFNLNMLIIKRYKKVDGSLYISLLICDLLCGKDGGTKLLKKYFPNVR